MDRGGACIIAFVVYADALYDYTYTTCRYR